MQFQMISIVGVVVVFGLVFMLRKRGNNKVGGMLAGSISGFRTDVAQRRRPDEGEPITLVATERKMLSAKLYFFALTNRTLYVQLAGGETQSFDRASCKLSFKAKTFADVGNMQTTYTSGYELSWTLPDGVRHTCRVYAHAEGIPDHGAHVQAMIHAVAA